MIIVGFICNGRMLEFFRMFFELFFVRRGWFGGIISGFFGMVWIVCCWIFGFFLFVLLLFIFFIVGDVGELDFLLILLFSDRLVFIICCGDIECVFSLGLCIGDSFLIYFVVILCFILGGVGMCLWSLLMVYWRGIYGCVGWVGMECCVVW